MQWAILWLHYYTTKPWNKDSEFKKNTVMYTQAVTGIDKIEYN